MSDESIEGKYDDNDDRFIGLNLQQDSLYDVRTTAQRISAQCKSLSVTKEFVDKLEDFIKKKPDGEALYRYLIEQGLSNDVSPKNPANSELLEALKEIYRIIQNFIMHKQMPQQWKCSILTKYKETLNNPSILERQVTVKVLGAFLLRTLRHCEYENHASIILSALHKYISNAYIERDVSKQSIVNLGIFSDNSESANKKETTFQNAISLLVHFYDQQQPDMTAFLENLLILNIPEIQTSCTEYSKNYIQQTKSDLESMHNNFSYFPLTNPIEGAKEFQVIMYGKFQNIYKIVKQMWGDFDTCKGLSHADEMKKGNLMLRPLITQAFPNLELFRNADIAIFVFEDEESFSKAQESITFLKKEEYSPNAQIVLIGIGANKDVMMRPTVPETKIVKYITQENNGYFYVENPNHIHLTQMLGKVAESLEGFCEQEKTELGMFCTM